MSKPRYDWWSYVKGMIRRYPDLCAKAAELHETSVSPNLSGMPQGKGSTSDPTANAALRQLPEINQREMDAVQQALNQTKELSYGEERLKMIRMVFWDKTHTVCGAAIKLNVSETTAVHWHGQFIRTVAAHFGLLAESDT